MKKVYLFLLLITICTLTGCGLRIEAKEDKDEKLYRIEIQDADGTNIVTLEEQSEMGDFFVDDDGKWNTAITYSDEGLTPQYTINVYQQKTPTVIPAEEADAYERILIYTTYENSDLVKVVIDDNAIHGMTYGVISEDNLTFYHKGTEEFFSALNNAISEKKF